MWKEIQSKHIANYTEEKKQPAYKTAEWWTAGVIQQLVYFSLNTWQIRNDRLHRNRIEMENNRICRELQDEMTLWYEHAANLGTAFGKYFQMPLLQRKTQTAKYLRS